MIKQVAMIIILSVLAIMFQTQLMQVLKGFFFVHQQIANGLGVIFATSKVGEIVQSVLALLLIPVVVGVLLAIIHFFLRQAHFAHTMTVIWVAWAVCLAAVLAHTGRVANQDGYDFCHPNKPTPAAPAKPGAPKPPTAQSGSAPVQMAKMPMAGTQSMTQ